MASQRPASPEETGAPITRETTAVNPSPAGTLHPNRQPTHPLARERHAETPEETSSETDSATDSSDEFNWDAEDDGVSVHKRIQGEKKAKRGRRLWLLFTKIHPSLRAIILAAIGGGILVTPALVFILRFPDNKVRPHVVPWSLWLGISWAVCCLISFAVDVTPRFLMFIIFACYGKAPETLKTQIELFMATAFWLKLALDVSAFWIALSVIRGILEPPGKYWTTINRVMQALFAAGIIIFVEKVFVRIIAIRFHQKALADRLHENRIALKALDKLSTATPQVSKKKKKPSSNTATPYTSRPGTPDLAKVKGGASKKEYVAEGAIAPMQGPGNEHATQTVRKRRRTKAVKSVLVDQLVDLKDAIGQVALKDSKFNKQSEIGSLYSARRLAQQLFSTLSSVYPPRSHLIVDDFYPYFRTEADAITAFRIFDKDDNGDISKKEMREAVQRIYRERKALSASLKDMSSAVAKLDAVMIGVAMIIIIFVCLLIFNDSGDVSSLVPLATIVLGFSFVFGNSAKTLFESLIFIFSTHVYDVGDLVIIDDQVLTVKEFGLFATTFRRVDGQEVVAPNSLLATAKLIHNLRRSGSMWETTEIHIAYSTPLEVIEQLKQRLKAYMNANSREWSGCEIWIDKMKYQTAMNLTIAVEHRNNWQDWGGRWARRNLFMKHFKGVLEELEIGYQLPVQPVVFHPASQPPPWVRGQESLFGNAGYHPVDPIRQAPSKPTLNFDRF
ncbi:hypothetical protein FRC03_011455 [Tulasnella sp. 419]|nr:hypothetical protein FRC03_011455 [Tulasnella sp. 419]